MSYFTAFKPVLLALYPLIYHSLIKHHLEMTFVEYGRDDVRLSEPETGLSSNIESLCKEIDKAVLELPLSCYSTPLHAFSKPCSLKAMHLKSFRKIFQFPKGTTIFLPHPSKKACNFARGEVCFYEAVFL